MKSVVITGTSSGIGFTTAKVLISQGVKVFGSVRTEADADRLQHALGPMFIPLLFDVTDDQAINAAAEKVRAELQNQTLWGLVNNAGVAIIGALLYMPMEKIQKQLDINLYGQLKVIRAFAPLLGADTTLQGKPGRIINISSVSGKHAFPYLGAYAISKFGLEAASETLRRELLVYGIDVIIVGPGTIATSIWDKAKDENIPADMTDTVYKDSAEVFRKYVFDSIKKTALPAEDVGNLILHILSVKNPKVRYAPVPNKFFNWTLINWLPKRWLDNYMSKIFGLKKKNNQ